MSNLSSGLPLFGACLSTPVIAPAMATNPEYLAGKKNILFTPGESANLARVNHEFSQGWTWGDACVIVVDAVRASTLRKPGE